VCLVASVGGVGNGVPKGWYIPHEAAYESLQFRFVAKPWARRYRILFVHARYLSGGRQIVSAQLLMSQPSMVFILADGWPSPMSLRTDMAAA
jgi:hypothetical protein